ncbi:maternal protein exuperantia [Periplaneta americana]|uniref:maternal protein exuperantia n=1 Tax=Periplaneta americana TaxID=6978 RepID=UPI0037E821DD
MVSTTVKENGVQGEELGLPPGDYRLVGWDLDTTGRRLIDEICQIAAFSPTLNFSQYVMPFRDMNPAARRRHNIRVVTVGRYRMLKDSKTGKVLKTKSEISGLSDFINWLETVKGNSDGVILLSHEQRKVAAPLLLEALQKYNLLEKFSAVVKGFANGYAMAEVKCAKTVRMFSLRTLSRVLLNNDEDLDNAADRARLTYQVMQQLCAGEDRPENNQGSGDGGDATDHGLVESVRDYAHTVTKEEMELAGLKVVLERQNSLRPIFNSMLRINRRERQRATNLRRILAEAGIDYEMLTATYSKDGKEGIAELLASKLTKAKPKEIEDLRELLVGHFDPESKPKTENKVESNKEAKPGAGDASGSSTPDTTTSSPVKAPSSSGETNTNSTNSPQSNATSPRKRSVSAGPVVTSSPESTAS